MIAAELLTADVVALFTRRPDGTYRLEAGMGFPAAAIDLEVHGRQGMVGRCIVERERIVGLQEPDAWPPEYLVFRPGGATPHAAMALPSEVANEVAAVLFVTRVGPERSYSELECGIADLLAAQVAIALQNADLHARVAESAVRDPLTGLPAGGEMEFVDCANADETVLLSFDRWAPGTPWEISTGKPVVPGELTVYPAPSS